ncbi:hypothetical protein VKT23_013834 [Stygiomarasmius scandens]|uniref:Rap1 Myb domain-containing protein n=1 Tax=Marasmiellus scandens TaxID=2682957 RepID=A0ABR1J1X0_9AGAR
MRDTRYKPHTNADDQRLIQYLATHDVRTGSASTYQSIVSNEDGTSPWGAERTWAAWRSRYAHHKQEFDRRIRQYRLKHGILLRDDSAQSGDHSRSSGHVESQSSSSVADAVSGSTSFNSSPACTTAISPYPTLSPNTISPSKNVHLTLIAERVINSNRFSKPVPKREGDTRIKSSPSTSFSSTTNSGVPKTEFPGRNAEDHPFLTAGPQPGTTKILPTTLSSHSSIADAYEIPTSDREKEACTVSPALPARMARKRHRTGAGYGYDSPVSADASERPTPASTRSASRDKGTKRVRMGTMSPGSADEMESSPIMIQSPRHSHSSSWLSRDTTPSTPNTLPSQRPGSDHLHSHIQTLDSVDFPFYGSEHVDLTASDSFPQSGPEKQDDKDAKSEISDSIDLLATLERSEDQVEAGDERGYSTKAIQKDRVRTKLNSSPTSITVDSSPLVSIPSGLGWGGLGHLVG